MRSTGRNLREVFLKVLVDGESVDCILDVVSEVTLIPGSLAQELLKKPIVSPIRAINGILFEVLGEADLPVVLKDTEVISRGVASDHIVELLFGIDRL